MSAETGPGPPGGTIKPSICGISANGRWTRRNSNHLAVVTGGSEIDVWSVNVDGVTRNLWRGSVPEQAEPLKIVALSPDGNLLITARGDSLAPTLWDLRTGAPRAVLYGHRERVLSAVFSPDGGKLATTSADGTAHVWDVSTGKETAALRGHTGAVIMAAFSPDGRRLVTVGIDDTARIWDLTEPPEIQDDSLASLIKQAEARVPAILGANKGLLEY
ncbi:MAG: hypothetical protein DMF53_17180 [Acidobacteria bacterium]|nr:MAG: hypothetical protein DMF53_17180 [Acidobacteriota bacterium]